MVKAAILGATVADITALKNVSWAIRAGLIVPCERQYDHLAGKAPWLAVDPSRSVPVKESNP